MQKRRVVAAAGRLASRVAVVGLFSLSLVWIFVSCRMLLQLEPGWLQLLWVQGSLALSAICARIALEMVRQRRVARRLEAEQRVVYHRRPSGRLDGWSRMRRTHGGRGRRPRDGGEIPRQGKTARAG